MKLDINIQITDRDTLETFIKKLGEIEKEHSGNCTLLSVTSSHYKACQPITQKVEGKIESIGSIFMTNGDTLVSFEKLELARDLDNTIGQYLRDTYKVNLVFPTPK